MTGATASGPTAGSPARQPELAGRERFVARLPFTADDLPAAQRFVRTLARSLSFLPEYDSGETTVSEEDDQGVRHRVFCDRLLDDGQRCLLRAEHDGQCAARRFR